MKRFKVYKITCKVNDKIYIGQTYENLNQRLKRHLQFARTGCNTKFYSAIRKYGDENFYIELLQDCDSQEELNILEYKWIKQLNATKFGYNTKCSIGKCGGDTLTNHPNLENIKKKISISKKGVLNPHHTRVVATNIETKEKLFFNCMKDAQNYFKIERHDTISKRCRGVIKSNWNNWVFEYLDKK